MIELAGSAAHVVVGSLDALDLPDTDLHHLGRVLRLRAGERVTATDGVGSWRWCRWDGHGLEADGPVGVVARPAPPVGVGFALVKGDRLDWIVQKLTEIGADVLVPVTTQRCVVRWDEDRAASQVERLRRIAREAAMQSRRVWLPSVEAVTPVADVLARPGAARADFGGRWLEHTDALEVSLIVVGPEGGWDPTEREQSAVAIQLADQVLRTETAAFVAGCGLVEARRRSPSPR